MIKKTAAYLRSDLYRLLTSVNLWLGIAGVFLLFYLIGRTEFKYTVSVFFVVNSVFYSLASVFCYILCAFPFACSFCEDFEFRYQYLMVNRGGIYPYVISKIITMMIASCLIMTAGVVIFAVTLSFFIPWLLTGNGGDLTNIEFVKFGYLLENGHHILFYFLYGLENGLQNAILSLLAALFSIRVPNRLLTLSIPVMGAYIIYEAGLTFGKNDPMFNFCTVFTFSYKLFSNDFLSFFYSVLFSVICCLLLGTAITLAVKRRQYV